MKDRDSVLRNYPKRRSPLPADYQEIYASHYKQNREGKTPGSMLSQLMERWMHLKASSDIRGRAETCPTLEIGAGTLNHLPYEPKTAPYDIVEPFTELYTSSENLPRVRRRFRDISEIPLQFKYQRILSIATFEHIENLPEVIARGCLLLEDGSAMRVGIPSEGTRLWKVAWKCTTGLDFRLRYGLDYEVIMRHVHVSTAYEIEGVLRYFFHSVEQSCFGLGRIASLYRFFICSRPQTERCYAYLDELS